MSFAGATQKNHILAALAAGDLALLLPHMQAVEMKQHLVLYNVGAPVDHIYFMERGVASIITNMENGASIETGMIGPEGVVPVTALLGNDISNQHIVIQLPGNGLRISLSRCRAAFEQSAPIRKAVLQCAGLLLDLSMQTAGCNRLHSTEQRLARWLLMSRDRFHSDLLPLTQEYLATMLGVRRARVTETAIALQNAGLIRYNNGQITITDRPGLERAACECYRIGRPPA